MSLAQRASAEKFKLPTLLVSVTLFPVLEISFLQMVSIIIINRTCHSYPYFFFFFFIFNWTYMNCKIVQTSVVLDILLETIDLLDGTLYTHCTCLQE